MNNTEKAVTGARNAERTTAADASEAPHCETVEKIEIIGPREAVQAVANRARQLSADKTAHTPGPWTDGIDNVNAKSISPYVKIDSEHDGIAYAFGRTPEERRANARLIAAAPDLLEALKELIQRCNDGWIPPEKRAYDYTAGWIDACEEFRICQAAKQAYAAIAKAEGRAQ